MKKKRQKLTQQITLTVVVTLDKIFLTSAILSYIILNLVFMALLKAVCWAMIFIIGIRFPPARLCLYSIE